MKTLRNRKTCPETGLVFLVLRHLQSKSSELGKIQNGIKLATTLAGAGLDALLAVSMPNCTERFGVPTVNLSKGLVLSLPKECSNNFRKDSYRLLAEVFSINQPKTVTENTTRKNINSREYINPTPPSKTFEKTGAVKISCSR